MEQPNYNIHYFNPLADLLNQTAMWLPGKYSATEQLYSCSSVE